MSSVGAASLLHHPSIVTSPGRRWKFPVGESESLRLCSWNKPEPGPGTNRDQDLLQLSLQGPQEALAAATCPPSLSPSGLFGSASHFKYLGDLESRLAALCHGGGVQGGSWWRSDVIGGTHVVLIGQLSAGVCPGSSPLSQEHFCCHQLLSGGSCGLMMTSAPGADKFIQHTHTHTHPTCCICCLYVHSNHGIMQITSEKTII